MKGLLRRLRGILGTGLTWAVGWTGVTVALNLVGGVPLHFLGQLVLSGMVRGFVAGGAFAVILSIAERRHTLEDLSLRRVALWGGIGGGFLFLSAVPFLLSLGFPVGGVLAPLVANSLIGAGFASGSVALARREDSRLIEGEDEPAFLIEGEDDPA